MSSIQIAGDTSGSITLSAPAVAGTNTITLPAVTGTILTTAYTGNVTFSGDLTVDTNTLYVDSANNRVGIGTNNPSSELEVASAAGTAIQITGGTSNSSQVKFADADSATVGLINYSHAANSMGFHTNDLERVTIDSSGNVGIGTSSPNQELHIQGSDPAIRIQDSDNTNQYADIAVQGGAIFYTVRNNTAHGQHLFRTFDGTTASERMRITSVGNVGIGTSSPSSKLHVNGTSRFTQTITADSNISFVNSAILYSASGNDNMEIRANNAQSSTASYVMLNGRGPNDTIQFRTNNTERARIYAGGGLRIGSTGTPPTNGILLPNNGALRTNGGTVFSTSIAGSTTALGANIFINSANGAMQRSTSSIKYKTDIEDLDSNISSNIYEMRPVWYRSLGDMDRKDWSYYGFIAEEVAKIEPRLVHWAEKEDGTLEAEGVMYDRLTVFLVAEMKKLKTENDTLKSQLSALETRIQALENA